MLNSPVLVDQNMVCGSNKDQRDHFPGIHLDVSLFSGIHQICILTFPFDPPMQSDTSSNNTMVYAHCNDSSIINKMKLLLFYQKTLSF